MVKKVGPPFQDPFKRIFAKVRQDEGDDCWHWTAAKCRAGYGVTWLNGKTRQAHRAIYTLMVADIPEGLELDHLCRVRDCVNPWHMDPVPHRVNTLRSENPSARNARLTRCRSGHEYAGDNLYINPNTGWRYCRECMRQSNRNRTK